MKGVFQALRDFMPGRNPVESEAAVAPPAPEAPRARPPRQIVDPNDILAAAETPETADPMDPPPAKPGVETDPALEARVLEAIKTVRDPEIPVNLVDLGLIYELVVGKDGNVFVEMTLTTPHCPSAAALPEQVAEAARSVDGVIDAQVKVVFSPPWHQDLMSEEAKLELGLL